MMAVVEMAAGALPVTIDEARAWLRMDSGRDDAVVAALIRAAAGLCEQFTGQMLIARQIVEERPIDAHGMRLIGRPFVGLDSVTGLAADDPDVVLPSDAVELSIDGQRRATLRVLRPGIAGRVRIAYRAGLAPSAGAVPEALRQGILRLAGHLHEARDSERDRSGGEPPAIVAALWQPWRRMELGR